MRQQGRNGNLPAGWLTGLMASLALAVVVAGCGRASEPEIPSPPSLDSDIGLPEQPGDDDLADAQPPSQSFDVERLCTLLEVSDLEEVFDADGEVGEYGLTLGDISDCGWRMRPDDPVSHHGFTVRLEYNAVPSRHGVSPQRAYENDRNIWGDYDIEGLGDEAFRWRRKNVSFRLDDVVLNLAMVCSALGCFHPGSEDPNAAELTDDAVTDLLVELAHRVIDRL